jgi:hypothetical protein
MSLNRSSQPRRLPWPVTDPAVLVADPVQASPTESVTSPKPVRRRLRFGLKSLMALPVLAAVALVAVDRWTAVPWSGLQQGEPIIFKIVDAATGEPFKGGSFTIFEHGTELLTMPASSGRMRHFGRSRPASGYQSLIRDTRRLDFGDMRIKVTADEFEDFTADASEIARSARLDTNDAAIEYIVRLRRR